MVQLTVRGNEIAAALKARAARAGRSAALQLGLELGHPVHDCFYLALAERMRRCLITSDSRFLKALRATPHAARVIALGAITP